ncbi:helix-turn-helix domain-containing protein [Streptomyces abikoensis]|uniref:helix-turn-helix domain-containing protein n=1 Tax=Streptomyces abikoensis TaxID=97398 RepID=UPI0019B759EA|nr:helix-turn-helix domain-containing protein [Streptomyces abikoensis]GGP55632.1 hypothetical protein GCM10010214_31030 [Streptomyces abikoensis]
MGRHLKGRARRELAAQLVREYQAGATVRALAGEMGRSYTLARALLLEAGVRMRPRGAPKREAR